MVCVRGVWCVGGGGDVSVEMWACSLLLVQKKKLAVVGPMQMVDVCNGDCRLEMHAGKGAYGAAARQRMSDGWGRLADSLLVPLM
jgi:hypothetical protein